MLFDASALAFRGRGVTLAGLEPIIDGRLAAVARRSVGEREVVWALAGDFAGATVRLQVAEEGGRLRLSLALAGVQPGRDVDALGVRFAVVTGAERYFRNGYQSWDGSYLTRPGDPPPDHNPSRSPLVGYAFTALLPEAGGANLVLGFTRCDRFQNRFRFSADPRAFTLDVETLWDRTAHDGRIEADPIVLYEADRLEEGFRAWSRLVAADSPLPPRTPERRLTGWCSWYNLYAAIDEAAILEHLAAARSFRDQRQVPLDIFLIDDGFTPEMGDWLDVKPQFPRGMKPLVADIAAAGFTPGLWIAPFMVGNRSKLFRAHPDWVVRDRATGEPIAHMTFYGEFRWHKRSE
ncbi:MAG TPA: alpha-galactosidase, partial [Haliangium sp.]|nr:alpha-galactosidase [Haliangium sp.]